MAKAFPDHPFLRGYYAPLHMECDADHLPISGEMPKELCGTLYRNGPNPQFAPRGFYHWFAGDGMLHAFHVEDGRVSGDRGEALRQALQAEHLTCGEQAVDPGNPVATASCPCPCQARHFSDHESGFRCEDVQGNRRGAF